ncbi:MAG: DUF2851 family protein [Prevotella sp.]|nr:DUF2851 family protein [Prevotella sp.]
MEQLLHYVWRHRLVPAAMTTTDGKAVEMIDPGLPNNGSGPDFFNAKVRIDGTMWVGNVEIHDRSTDWVLHGHHRDAAYDSVVLHVTGKADAEVADSSGRCVPQVRLDVPESVARNYEQLLHEDRYPLCHRIIPALGSLKIGSWLATLQTERLERKTADIRRRAEQRDGSWEDACFITLARNYGFGANSDAFEQWAACVPLAAVAHHRDDLFQTEAIFMGQAGLLDPGSIPERYRSAALADDYYCRLRREYDYLSHKFGLTPMDHRLWRFMRLRPQNFPHVRISQLANLYCGRRMGLRALTECRSADELRALFSTGVTPYWQTHYTFAAESTHSGKHLSGSSLDLLLINTAIPMIFAYGRHISDESLCCRATDMLESLRPENNRIIRMWRECGLTVRSAGDTQALIQLKNEYCDRRECLRCRFGYEYLKQKDND